MGTFIFILILLGLYEWGKSSGRKEITDKLVVDTNNKLINPTLERINLEPESFKISPKHWRVIKISLWVIVILFGVLVCIGLFQDELARTTALQSTSVDTFTPCQEYNNAFGGGGC